MFKSHCHFVNGLSLIRHWRTLLEKMQCISIVWKPPQVAIALPRHLSADEKHTHLSGEKAYIPTVVGDGCISGVSVTESAGQKDLEKACDVFKQERRIYSPTIALTP